MKRIFWYSSVYVITSLIATLCAQAQNPFIRDQFTADPTARVFNNRVYVYPSHDILAKEGKGRVGWFCMEDYHVFSSDNLTDWTDHGVIVTQNKVPWVRPDGYSMWAPDCVFRNNKYYFYFPTFPKDTTSIGRGFTIGVAIADKPEGPFVPQAEPIKNVKGIDPNVFIDKNGQAYLYWSAGQIFGARLKPNMLELDSEVKVLGDLPTKGLKEGPFVFERNGVYYMTYPHVENKIERLEYAIGDNPLGPFKITGVLMDESPTGCWTNHHSLAEFKGQWYLFYHHNDYSPKFDKARSVRVDSLFFNADNTIRKVRPTLRGVGLTKADKPIQVDRYSKLADSGIAIDLLDSADTFKGWKTVFSAPGAWIQYNGVDFGSGKAKKVIVNAKTNSDATLQIRLNSVNGPVLSEIKLSPGTGWNTTTVGASGVKSGVHPIVVLAKDGGQVEVDWIRFE